MRRRCPEPSGSNRLFFRGISPGSSKKSASYIKFVRYGQRQYTISFCSILPVPHIWSLRCQTCFCYGYITASPPQLAAPGSTACCRGGGAGDEINPSIRNALGIQAIHNILRCVRKTHYQRNRQTGSLGSYSYDSTENHHR